jgi:GGDEF domain-containing protein
MSEVDELREQVRALQDELDALKVTLEVVGTVDFDSGMLSRSGVLDALERGQQWLARRGDIYGLLVVAFPSLHADARHGPEATEFRSHVAATMGAAVRDVDSVGRLDDHTFAAVLSDLNAGAIQIVADRMRDLLERLVASNPLIGGTFRIAGLEVLSNTPSGDILDGALMLSLEANPGPVLGQIG